MTFSSRPLGVVLDRFIRTSPRVRSLNFRFADHTPGGSAQRGVHNPEAPPREELAAAVGQVLDILSDDEEEDE